MQVTCIMANEISLSLSLSASKNAAAVSVTYSGTMTMTGDQFISNVQIVGTSNEALVVGDVSTLGWIVCKNLDATNYVEIFLDASNTQLVAKLLPGEPCLFKPGSVTVYARANTGSCNVQVTALEL